MRQRLTGAAVLVPVVVIVFLLGNPWLTIGIAALAGLAAYETSRLVRGAGLATDTAFAVVVAVAAVLGTFVLHVHDGFGSAEPIYPRRIIVAIAFSGFALVVVAAGFLALRHREPSVGFRSWSGNLIAALYPALLAFLAGIIAIAPAVPQDAVLFDRLDAGRVWLLILVLTVWSYDSFAYVAGKYHGRGRFMNHISPNKTWSGVIGGSIAAVIVCSVLALAAGQHVVAGAALGLVIAISAQAGDLAESILKRSSGAKDSGSLIPGHGGILDRIDSFLFAAPAMFVALAWAQLFAVP
jgi:phosphatidate cytidylyltransferase